jgi:hypothetical protein
MADVGRMAEVDVDGYSEFSFKAEYSSDSDDEVLQSDWENESVVC